MKISGKYNGVLLFLIEEYFLTDPNTYNVSTINSLKIGSRNDSQNYVYIYIYIINNLFSLDSNKMILCVC